MSSEDLYQRLYDGELLYFPTNEATTKLQAAGSEVVDNHFGEAPEKLEPERFRKALTQARARVGAPDFRELAAATLSSIGFDLEPLKIDTVRLRAVSPGLKTVEAAAPVFFSHRDTWYGNPSCQINAWLPLVPVHENNSFQFFPYHFHNPVKNDSHRFMARKFQAEGGFGSVGDTVPSVYPRALEKAQGEEKAVVMNPGELLLFSAAHLHQTSTNKTGLVRFSLDFRFFSASHFKQGRGAPDPDNRSQGLILTDYESCSH